MKKHLGILIVLLILLSGLAARTQEPAKKGALPSFKMQEIATDLKVGYAVLLVDLNGDNKKDIVVVDTARLVWYENPTWKRRTIIEGQTKPDNVCIAAHDIDGDGQLDLALGADWKPMNTKDGGTLQWLKRGKTLDDPWTLYPITTEPTTHRIRFADVLGEGKPQLINVPLMGRNSTKEKNWMDGSPVRIIAHKIPKDPTRDRWEPVIVNETLHVIHNFVPSPSAEPRDRRMNLLAASYEGVTSIYREGDQWRANRVGAGNQDNPNSNRGASEIKVGQLKAGSGYIATIEPWHGHQVVVYDTSMMDDKGLYQRRVLDDQLKWGHGVWCADLDGDGDEELIIGVRDNLSNIPGERCGVRIYKATDGKGAKWERTIIDDGGVAVEDLAAADLNGDGKIDIIAVGRATHNLRVYWNEGKKD